MTLSDALLIVFTLICLLRTRVGRKTRWRVLMKSHSSGPDLPPREARKNCSLLALKTQNTMKIVALEALYYGSAQREIVVASQTHHTCVTTAILKHRLRATLDFQTC